MAPKNAVAKEQDISHAPAPFTAAANAFNLAVEECVRDADPDSVHRVRTGSRRLQAMLEAMLRENSNPLLQETAKAWLRPLKQVRRAAGAVRDLDVHRKLLQHWVSTASPLAGAGEGSPLAKQAETLDAWLQNTRKHLAHGMQKRIKKRQQRLAEKQAGFLAIGTVSRGSVKVLRSCETVALEDFVRAVDTMPLLDAENLHDFRKATKKARYVAESGTEEQTNNSVAKALKRVQDTIGEWHDWLCLHEEAKTALGERAPDLSAFLEREVERHFAIAMKTTQIMRARLAGEWMAMRQSPAKRPPASVTIADRRLAKGTGALESLRENRQTAGPSTSRLIFPAKAGNMSTLRSG